MARETVTLTPEMSTMVEHFSSTWNVSKAEAMRRLFGIGTFVAKEFEKGHEIHTIDPANRDKSVQIVFAGS